MRRGADSQATGVEPERRVLSSLSLSRFLSIEDET